MLAALAAMVIGNEFVTKLFAQERRKPQKWAILIGVDDYAFLKKLKFAGSDQRALADQLAKSGFPRDQIFLLHDKAQSKKYLPFRANIEEQLGTVLRLARSPEDLVIVGFSGHGVTLDGKAYLCPTEAKFDDPESTMVPLEEVFGRLKDCHAALKLMLVDACRNNPEIDGKRSARSAQAGDFVSSLKRPPAGLLLISSCGERQTALEDADFGHGVFMHFVLDGLRGKAANDDGAVTLARLYDYASFKTEKHVARKFGAFQTPALEGKIDGSFEICRIDSLRSTITSAPAPVPIKPGETITNSIGMKLVLVPPGEFLMGSPAEEVGRNKHEQQHRVRITKPFYMGAHEVTVDQFLKFYHDANYAARWTAQNGGTHIGIGLKQLSNGKYDHEAGTQYVPWSWGHPDQTKEHPVVNVNWNDAVAFCEWLSRKEGKMYRLPTEAEWEYACRAGTTTRFSNGNQADRLNEIANVADTSYRQAVEDSDGIPTADGHVFTSPVGSLRPNALGLYDMHGNAEEWCSDWYSESFYSHSPRSDPEGPISGSQHVIRGGRWVAGAAACRSAARSGLEPAYRMYILGFRIVCVR